MRPAAVALLLWRTVLALTADVLAPHGCAACSGPLRRRAVFCAPCAATVVPSAPSRLGANLPLLAYGVYGGALSTALKRLKYDGRPDLAGPLGALLRHALLRCDREADVVLPVPLHPRRLAERGYNQAALLASEAADAIGASVETGTLVRVRHTPQQARLALGDRLRNVEGAFAVRRPARIRGHRVVLVDDVVTTGATLRACADALCHSGVRSVVALAVARADHVSS